MNKLTLVVAFGAGYVLGARAGRERYEQIKAAATRVKDDPRVQHTTAAATDLAKEKAKEAAPVVKEKVASAAGAVTEKVHAPKHAAREDLEAQLNPDNVALQDDPYPQGNLP